MKNPVTVYLVNSEEISPNISLQKAFTNTDIEEIFNLNDPVCMIPIKKPVIGTLCIHVQPFDLDCYL